MCSSKYCFKRHKSMDQKVFTGCNLAWLQKKGHFWDNWIQRAKHKGTFILFIFNRYIYNHSLTSKHTFGVKTGYTVILTTYFSFFFFLFMYTFFSFLFFYVQNTVVLITQFKVSPMYLTIDLHLPFLSNLNRNMPYLNVPLLYGKGTSYQWRFRV